MAHQVRSFDNTEDTLDTRDLESAITQLENDDHGEDLAVLKEFRQELIDAFEESCLEDGVILIRDSYFKDYAQELAEDIGAISRDLQWPLLYIDWEAAANDLKHDYSSVTFGGVEYWGRE